MKPKTKWRTYHEIPSIEDKRNLDGSEFFELIPPDQINNKIEFSIFIWFIPKRGTTKRVKILADKIATFLNKEQQ